MSEKLMQHLASMAERRPLRALYILCDGQKQVSTGKLRDYLDHAGDALAGYAATLRHEFDMLTAAAPAAPVVQEDVQPVAWQARHTDDGVWMPCGQYYHEQIQADPQRFVGIESRPLYASPPAHDAALVEALNICISALSHGASCQRGVVETCCCRKCAIDNARAALAGKGSPK